MTDKETGPRAAIASVLFFFTACLDEALRLSLYRYIDRIINSINKTKGKAFLWRNTYPHNDASKMIFQENKPKN
jgi:hypothetical protein